MVRLFVSTFVKQWAYRPQGRTAVGDFDSFREMFLYLSARIGEDKQRWHGPAIITMNQTICGTEMSVVNPERAQVK